VAHALVQAGFHVTVVTGGSTVPGFPGPGVDTIALPPLLSASAGFSGLVDGNGETASDDYLDNRRNLLLDAFRRIGPDIVITEAFPFGRRQMRFELLPLLQAIEATTPRPKVLASIRDILQARTKPGRDEETVALVREHFDHVLVHGDPSFVTLPETFPLAGEISGRIVYTGLVAAPAAPPCAEVFDIVVSAGGGAVGIDLLRAAREAAARSAFSGSWCLITGPNLPERDFAALHADVPANVGVFRFRKDFASLLRNARLSISQAGYNTVCDVLQAQCRSILVPFTAGGETEQSVRAARLEALGLALALPEDGIDADVLGAAVETALASPRPPAHSLDLTGARTTARLLRQLL
ncbi:MAG: glycosyltransferase family protein, partial [Phyllobacterium sp.]